MNEKLKQSLEELRDELKRIGSVHPEIETLQKKTMKALEAGGHLPVIEDLKKAADLFETRYPQLTAILNNVMNSLSNLGI